MKGGTAGVHQWVNLLVGTRGHPLADISRSSKFILPNTNTLTLSNIMSISTRSTYYPRTPSRSERAHEYDSITKTRFYNALDRSGKRKSFRTITREYAPSHGTGCRWKKERELLGSPSYRHTRKLSTRLGQPPKISAATTQMLVDPKRNPVRE